MRQLQRQDDVIALQDASLDLAIMAQALASWLEEIRGKALQRHDFVVTRVPNVNRLRGLCGQVNKAAYKLRGYQSKKRSR